jgi:hypothetical protein
MDNSETAWLIQQLLPRFQSCRETRKGVLYNELPKGRVEDLESSSDYRLFFLMEGKAFMNCESSEKYLLQGGHFSLLPPGCPISCASFTKSCYSIVTCTGLTSASNRDFVEKLKDIPCRSIPTVTALPIRDKLDKILYNFATYTCNEYQYPDIYDTVFIILRVLYTPEELVSLLFPMLTASK